MLCDYVAYVDCENVLLLPLINEQKTKTVLSSWVSCEMANSHLFRLFPLDASVWPLNTTCTTHTVALTLTEFNWFRKTWWIVSDFGTPFVLFACQKISFCFRILISWINTHNHNTVEVKEEHVNKPATGSYMSVCPCQWLNSTGNIRCAVRCINVCHQITKQKM